MFRSCLITFIIVLMCAGAISAQEPSAANDSSGVVQSTLPVAVKSDSAEAQEASEGITADTLWKMTERAGGMRWPIYIVFAIGLAAIVYKIIQLLFDSKHTRPFIRQRSEEEEAALQADTHSNTLRNLLEHKIKSHTPEAIVGLASRYPKSKVARLLKALGELASRTKNAVAFQEEVSGFVRRERDRFEVWKNFTSLMSDTAGALGLLGTVWGMYITFIGGDLQPEQILSGMGIALVTTLLGLIVSITINILSTGVVKMFSDRLELIEFAGDTFRGRFAESDGVIATSPQPIMSQSAAAPAAGVAASDVNVQMLSKRVPMKLVVMNGNHQRGEVNSSLPKPLEVQVLDQDETGLPKQKVHFEVNGSDCSFNNGETEIDVATDSRGRAKVNVVLGKSVGEQTLIARLKSENGGEDLVQELKVESHPGPPSVIKPLPGTNHQQALLKEKLPTDLGIKLEDDFGNPIAHRPVIFRVITSDVVTNSGRFENRKSEIEVETDDEGIATTPFWVGEEVGPNVVRAVPKMRGSNVPEAVFYSTGKDA